MVERAGFENQYGRKLIASSNLALSAKKTEFLKKLKGGNMVKAKEKCDEEMWKMKKYHPRSRSMMGGGIYFLAFIGSALYFIQQSDSFWMGVLGVLKALVWPAMLIYKVFTTIHM